MIRHILFLLLTLTSFSILFFSWTYPKNISLPSNNNLSLNNNNINKLLTLDTLDLPELNNNGFKKFGEDLNELAFRGKNTGIISSEMFKNLCTSYEEKQIRAKNRIHWYSRNKDDKIDSIYAVKFDLGEFMFALAKANDAIDSSGREPKIIWDSLDLKNTSFHVYFGNYGDLDENTNLKFKPKLNTAMLKIQNKFRPEDNKPIYLNLGDLCPPPINCE